MIQIKKIVYLLLFLPLAAFTQAPEAINYQALIRDASGVVVANQNVGDRKSVV